MSGPVPSPSMNGMMGRAGTRSPPAGPTSIRSPTAGTFEALICVLSLGIAHTLALVEQRAPVFLGQALAPFTVHLVEDLVHSPAHFRAASVLARAGPRFE